MIWKSPLAVSAISALSAWRTLPILRPFNWLNSNRKARSRFFAVVGLLSLLLAVNARPAQGDTPYRFGPGDVLAISVFGQQGLSGRFKISAEGNISYPVLGEIAVANLTGPELATKIGQLLSRQLPGAGSVSAEVAEYAPVFILAM